MTAAIPVQCSTNLANNWELVIMLARNVSSMPHGNSEFFFVPHPWLDEKTSFYISLPKSKLTIFLVLYNFFFRIKKLSHVAMDLCSNRSWRRSNFCESTGDALSYASCATFFVLFRILKSSLICYWADACEHGTGPRLSVTASYRTNDREII